MLLYAIVTVYIFLYDIPFMVLQGNFALHLFLLNYCYMQMFYTVDVGKN